MPANPKYLSSRTHRILKITGGILGGFMVTMALHLLIGAMLENKSPLVITTAFSAFFVWVGTMVVAFLFRNGWKLWGVYLSITLVCSVLIYFLR
ncbi:MAG: hypothetical protein AAGN35_17985 [Bacteroidota bacterium]